MGIDLSLYRCRIGRFRPRKMNRCASTVNTFDYNPTTKSSDVHLRTLVLMSFTLFIVFSCQQSLLAVKHLQSSNISAYIGHEICSESSLSNENSLLCLTKGTLVNTDFSTPIHYTAYDIIEQLLMQSSDVELNPGPGSSAPKGRGGKHTATTKSSNARVPARVEDETHTIHDNNPTQARELRLISRRSDLQMSQQPSVSSWLRPDNNIIHSSDDNSASEQESDNESTDTTAILLEIRKDVKRMNKKFDSVEKSVNYLKSENKILKSKNEKLTNEMSVLTSKVENMETIIAKNTKKQEQLELQSKKCNLKFYGLNQEQNETAIDSETKVRRYILNDLEISDDDYSIDNSFRIPSRSSPKPILVQFSNVKQRDTILSSFRSLRKRIPVLQVRVGEDLPERIAKARTGLYPFLRESIDQGKRAFFKQDILVVNGEKYMYDSENECHKLIPTAQTDPLDNPNPSENLNG